MATKILQKLLTALYPDRCLFCDRAVEPGVVCCKRCLEELPHLAETRLPPEADQPYRFVAAPFAYRDGVRRAVVQFKFHGRADAAGFFAPYLCEAVGNWRPDWVVPVPMADHRRTQRGYNQAELLAQPLAQSLGAEYHPEALVRTGTVAQHELSARLRRIEAQHSFALAPGAVPAGKRILLVDDVCTTGSTLRRCAWLLLDGGAAEVACVVAAATPKR